MDRNIKQLIAIADGKHARWLEVRNTSCPDDSFGRVKYMMAYNKALDASVAADKALREALEPIEIGSCPQFNAGDDTVWQGD